MNRICSVVGPLEGYTKFVRTRVCDSGALIEEVEMLEAGLGMPGWVELEAVFERGRLREMEEREKLARESELVDARERS